MRNTILKGGVMVLAFAMGVTAAGIVYFKNQQIEDVTVEEPPPVIKHQTNGGNTVEMVFVLDTTGSMGGLLEGAKQKIWGIINEVMQRSSNPSVRVGFVAYRDNNDEYVTRIVPLTDDLDAFYIKLMELKAGGGGDGPENVQRGLSEGVEKAGWTDSSSAKILFLVGDAPSHKYQNEIDVLESTAKALRNNMIVNTIQCGSDPETKQMWQQLAKSGQGKYFAIAQNGGVETIETPYDHEIASLGGKMSETFIAYGSRDEREERSLAAASANSAASAAPRSTGADRALNKAMNRNAYNGDLLQDMESGKTSLDDVKAEELPEEMQKLSGAERRERISQKLAERNRLRGEIVELSKKRDSYIKEKARSSGKQGGFDAAVSSALDEQLSGLGIK